MIILSVVNITIQFEECQHPMRTVFCYHRSSVHQPSSFSFSERKKVRKPGKKKEKMGKVGLINKPFIYLNILPQKSKVSPRYQFLKEMSIIIFLFCFECKYIHMWQNSII